MKLLSYQIEKEEMVGVLSPDEDRVYTLHELGLPYKDMLEVIQNLSLEDRRNIAEKMKKDPQGGIPFSEIRLLAPIPRPRQDILCLGANYSEHMKETNQFLDGEFQEKDAAIYFAKRVNEAVAPMGEIDSHTDLVKDLDYEAELAVIIKKDAKNVKAQDAAEYVFGYTIVNDVSARTLQRQHKQWYVGKSLDGFTPMGPWIVTADEFNFPPALKIKCKVNNQIRQESSTDHMIHGIPEVIEELTKGMTLQAGSIIITGTPAGVGAAMDPPGFLKSGDTVECIIEGIGNLTNTVK